MAHLQESERAALTAGYLSYGESRKQGRMGAQNPFPFRSAQWRAWEIGDYLNDRQLPLTEFTRERGGVYRNAQGEGFKVTTRKSGQFYGIGVERVS